MADTSSNRKSSDDVPWENGYYWCRDMPKLLFLVDGENATHKKLNENSATNTKLSYEQENKPELWQYGDFGEAHP